MPIGAKSAFQKPSADNPGSRKKKPTRSRLFCIGGDASYLEAATM
jgi:hypothetical protein